MVLQKIDELIISRKVMPPSINLSLFILFLFLPSQFQLFGQDISATISGKVEVIKDTTGLFFSPPNRQGENKYALPGATVLLLNTDSTSIVGMATNMHGEFKFNDIEKGKYLLQAKHLGYEDVYVSVDVKTGEKLDTVIIVGKIYPESELPFGAKEAESDLYKGIVEIREFSLIKIREFVSAEIAKKAEAQVQKKMGFTTKDITEEYKDYNWYKVNQATIRYNEVVKKYLSKKYGLNWREKYEEEVERLIKLNTRTEN